VCAVAAEADDAIVGDVGMKNRGLPSEVWYHSGVSGPEFDKNFVVFGNSYFSVTVSLKAQAVEHQAVFLGRIPAAVKRKNRTFFRQFLNGLKI
jgi:hypothetical protein